MKIQEKCLPCLVNQAIKTANMVGLEDKNQLLKRMFAYMAQADFETMSSPELIGEIFKIIKEETGNDDPYKQTRDKYNKMFMERLPVFEEEIKAAENPFEEAVKYAIIGNIIDFNPIHELTVEMVEEQVARLKKESLEINDSDKLLEELKDAKTLLYLGDNCGEICLDKLLVKRLKELNPECQIYFGTRGAAVVNDSIEEDAYLVGINDYATIISNGDYSLGTVLSRTSKEFNDIYYNADIILTKGQANYECLSTETGNIYFLLMTKCDVLAKDINVPEMKMIIKKKTEI